MATNPYPGVNAHLNSALLQPDGGWESFHAAHIIDLARSLTAVLPKHYYAAAERSLQITSTTGGGFYGPQRRTRPDVSIFKRRPGSPVMATASSPVTARIPIRATSPGNAPENWPSSVGIYRLRSPRLPGELVTRLELLSPANKPGERYFSQYWARREETLSNSVHVLELDYLHTTPPLLEALPSYPDVEQGATPYMVLVTMPLPTPDDGDTDYYAVAVDEPLPRIVVPLADGDAVVLDLQQAYNTTFNTDPIWEIMVDYTQPPVDMDAYTEADQARIRELMAAFPA